MKVVIRQAKKSDVKVVGELNKYIFDQDRDFDKFLDLNWPDSLAGRKHYRQVVGSRDYCCLIAEIKGKPVGYLAGKRKFFGYRKPRAAEIEHMAVIPIYRSQGIGGQLVEEFKKWCRKKRLKRIYVWTYMKNKKAMKFYKKQELKPLQLALEGEVE